MARTAQIYDLTIPANGTVQLLVEGGLYKLLSASGDLKIAREGGSAIGPILPGQGERIDFRRLTLTDLSGVSNPVEILVADESFIDTRIYGNVQVIDGGRLITMANQAFGGFASQAAVVGNFSHVQLWNPVGRTVNIALSKVIMSSFSSLAFQLRWYATPLTTLWANPNNKKIGVGPNSTAELRQEAAASLLGSGANISVFGGSIVPVVVDFKEPIVITPGMGVMVAQQNANAQVAASFDFYEFTP